MGLDYEFPDNFDFTYFDRPDDYPVEKVKPTRASTVMKPESHPWLQFRDVEKHRKIHYMNKLAEIQDYPVAKPKIVDWHLLERLGVLREILDMIHTPGLNPDLRLEAVPMWERVFKQNSPAHREWCLEFYSTLNVEQVIEARELTMKQTIHFRLGGRDRHCTVFGFAYLTGMLSAAEMREAWTREFLLRGDFDSSKFHDQRTFDEYWFDISGIASFDSRTSKQNHIRSKRLRILHKMITNSYLHRGDNHNKVYSEDLWLLRYFSELGPREHVAVPYLLARHMSRHREKRLLCGHFVSMIAFRLGLHDSIANTRHLSNPVHVEIMGELDFVKSGLLTADRARLLADTEAPAPPARQRRRREEPEEPENEDEDEEADAPQYGPEPYGIMDIRDSLRNISMGQMYMIDQQRHMASLQDRMGYTMGYYQPLWHTQMEQMYQARPDPADRQMPVYSPPEVYTPRAYQPDYPHPPYTAGGAGGSQSHFPSFSYAGDAGGYGGASGSGGAGGSDTDPRPVDRYGAGLFGTSYDIGGGTPSCFPYPGDEE